MSWEGLWSWGPGPEDAVLPLRSWEGLWSWGPGPEDAVLPPAESVCSSRQEGTVCGLQAAPTGEGRGPFTPSYVGAAWSSHHSSPRPPEGPWWELSLGGQSRQCAGTPSPEAHVRTISPVAEPTHSHLIITNPSFLFLSFLPFSSFPQPPSILPTSCCQSALWVVRGQ